MLGRESSYHPHSSIFISLLHRHATQLPWFPFDVGENMGENFYRLLILNFYAIFVILGEFYFLDFAVFKGLLVQNRVLLWYCIN